jgi:glycosyltransferase involved in cell wall biosynthesis
MLSAAKRPDPHNAMTVEPVQVGIANRGSPEGMTSMTAPPQGPDFIVFSIGDSRKPRTWSNVPYFFTRTLEQEGYQVKHVDIAPPRLLQLMFDVPWKAFCRLTGRNTRFTFLRSGINRKATERKIRRTLDRFPTGHCVFTTFSFGTGGSRPYTLFCDQTFANQIAYFDEREPDALELPTIREELRNLDLASLVIVFFPEEAERLAQLHGSKIKYYGNVVNVGQVKVDPQAAIDRKKQSREIVFIGSRKYREGLEHLAQATEVLNSRGMRDLVVNVIGMDRRDLPSAPANMRFHGYLDKGKPAEYRQYFDILGRSKAFVNPNPKWAAFSASSEAMYFCTPVVIFPYREFQRTFGDTNAVGKALHSARPEELADAIAELLADDAQWAAKALAAHDAARPMTWESLVRAYLNDLGLCGN